MYLNSRQDQPVSQIATGAIAIYAHAYDKETRFHVLRVDLRSPKRRGIRFLRISRLSR